MKIKTITNASTENTELFILWTNQKGGSGQEFFIRPYKKMKELILTGGFCNYKKGFEMLEKK